MNERNFYLESHSSVCNAVSPAFSSSVGAFVGIEKTHQLPHSRLREEMHIRVDAEKNVFANRVPRSCANFPSRLTTKSILRITVNCTEFSHIHQYMHWCYIYVFWWQRRKCGLSLRTTANTHVIMYLSTVLNRYFVCSKNSFIANFVYTLCSCKRKHYKGQLNINQERGEWKEEFWICHYYVTCVYSYLRMGIPWRRWNSFFPATLSDDKE